MADYRPRAPRMADYRPAKSRSIIPPESAPHGESLPESAPHGEIPPENSPRLASACMLAQRACVNGIAHIPAAARHCSYAS